MTFCQWGWRNRHDISPLGLAKQAPITLTTGTAAMGFAGDISELGQVAGEGFAVDVARMQWPNRKKVYTKIKKNFKKKRKKYILKLKY